MVTNLDLTCDTRACDLENHPITDSHAVLHERAHKACQDHVSGKIVVQTASFTIDRRDQNVLGTNTCENVAARFRRGVHCDERDRIAFQLHPTPSRLLLSIDHSKNVTLA